MDPQYHGPKIIESYLMKKRIKYQENYEEKTVLRYFKFNAEERKFIYKDDQDTKEIKMIYTGKDLKLFLDSVETVDQNISEYLYGFQIITSGKNFTLFAETKEIYRSWMRILNYHFNKIDILNPSIFLGNQGNSANVKEKQPNNQNKMLR